jgi:1-deoxy-D-xylulose-5-phosphate synthase
VHVRTQKGHGWPAALADAGKRLHDISPGPIAAAAADVPPTWSAAISGLLSDLAATDDRVHAITAAMPDTVGLVGFAARYPERVHDLGIAEQACVATAAGLASQGRRPFVALVTTFLTRALDQVLNDVALHRLPVVFLLDRAGITGPDGASHHGIHDVGLLRHIPGAEIYAPATVADAEAVLRDSLRREHGPIFVRYPKGRPLASGRTGLIRDGRDACLVTYGPIVARVLEAARILSTRHGVECAVWRLHRIHPLSPELARWVAAVPVVIPVEEVAAPAGIAEPLAAELLRRPDNRVRVVARSLPDDFLPQGDRDDLLEEFGFGPEMLAAFVRTTLA